MPRERALNVMTRFARAPVAAGAAMAAAALLTSCAASAPRAWHTERVAAEQFVPVDNFGTVSPSVSAGCDRVAVIANHVVWLFDRQRAEFIQADVGNDGLPARGQPSQARISLDGRSIAFSSTASNLAPGDRGFGADAFVRDLDARRTQLVSRSTAGAIGNAASLYPWPGADGRRIAFQSLASNLVAGDRNAASDVFLHDLEDRTTRRLSIALNGGDADGPSISPVLSADGRHVAFSSGATNLVPDDRNESFDAFVVELATGRAERVSVPDGAREGNEARGASDSVHLSADGRFAVFSSDASNLVPGDENGFRDVFVRDRQTGETRLVSRGEDGGAGNGPSDLGQISADGERVAFASAASDLVPGDRNEAGDVFLWHRASGKLMRVNRPVSAADAEEADEQSAVFGPQLSADGRCVVYDSYAGNLTRDAENGLMDVFISEAPAAR